MKYICLLITCIGLFLFSAFKNAEEEEAKYALKLSGYGFFEGDLKAQEPSSNVFLYELNSPLFSDYAEKLRFIHLPEGEKMTYNAEQVFGFPNGTAIIKTFYYYEDARKPEKGRNLIETRVLLKENGEWTALPYIWNEAQTDAQLSMIGGKKEVEWRDRNGKKQKLNYSIPNKNQCKGCHKYGKELIPIGPNARQLNKEIIINGNLENQLLSWNKEGLILDMPKKTEIPKLVDYQDDAVVGINLRARAYLDSNCGHCHNPEGAANTSGLFLNIHESEKESLGINKAPIAAGRGSGGFQFSIAPGKPNESILVYRMKQNDPGVRMPEIGRQLEHKEGVQLIEEWIKGMENY